VFGVKKKYIYAVKPAYNGTAVDRLIFFHSQEGSAEQGYFKYESSGLQIIRIVNFFPLRQAFVLPRFRLREVSFSIHPTDSCQSSKY
jgi:hypothetical protein